MKEISTADRTKIKRAIKRINEVGSILNKHVFERERETDGILLSVVAGASCLFVGEPGTGKTHHIRAACTLLGLSAFDILISETTKPDSIFGPPDIPALAKGIQRTKTKGYAPEAEVLFFDELFKASGIVLNPLLWLVNEHQYRNGDEGVIKCPTMAVFAASNELPTDQSLKAIYDRFILRYNVQYLKSKENLGKMLDSSNSRIKEAVMSKEDVLLLRKTARQIEIPEEVRDIVFALRDQLMRGAQISVSDRRLVKAFRILQARALLNGRSRVVVQDITTLVNVFWDTPEQIRKVRAIVLAVSNAKLSELTSYEDLVEELWQKGLKTGDLEESGRKIFEIYKGVKKFKSDEGKELAGRIRNYLVRIKSIQAKRTDLVIIEMVDADNVTWYKLSSSSSLFWSTQQLRSAKFRHRRKGGYWWIAGVDKEKAKKFRKKLKRRIQSVLGVEPKFQSML